MNSEEDQEKLLQEDQNGEEEEDHEKLLEEDQQNGEDEEDREIEDAKIEAKHFEQEEIDYEGSSEMEDDDVVPGSLDPLTLLETQDQSGSFPKTNIVLRLSSSIKPEAVTWLIEKFTGKKQDGGAELLVRAEPFSGKSNESIILHVTASKLKFLECAEYLELKKLDCRGVLREFNVGDLDDFLHGSIGLDNLLTAAEKQLIVTHEMDNVRVLAVERTLPGYSETILHRGQSIFNIYVQEGLILDVFPLHDEAEVETLGKQWYYALFKAQPFDEIRQYFGDAIALYFSFLGYYTVSLVAPAVLGIVQFFLSETTTGNSAIFFCIFNLIWITITQELWKRKCSELAYAWGTLRMTHEEDPRANYRGVMTIDPVTGRYQPYSPYWKTAVKVYCVSFPIVILSICAGAYVMLYSIWLEDYLTEAKQRHGSQVAGYMTMLPSIGYSALVSYVNNGYHKVANSLTEWENHRTQSQFERHRVSKLVMFEFVHTFMSMFYLAFYIQDMEMLKNQVTVMLLVNQFINHFKEALLPLVIRRGFSIAKVTLAEKFPNLMDRLRIVRLPKDKAETEASESEKAAASAMASGGLQFLESTDSRIEETSQQIGMEAYEGTFDDYLEMFIQFGYVFLFSAVSPLAAVYAIINNIIEIRADAFKLCKVTQRPLAKRVKDIGAWQPAFELIGVMAVTTNCALLCLSPNLRAYGSSMTSAEWLLLFVIIEHILIAVKLGIAILIPDIPQWVKRALACVEFRSRQALKNEQTFKSRRHLTRRFKTIHVAGKKGTTGSGMGTTGVQRRKPKRQNNSNTVEA